jgi:hypothetical protein
MRQLLSRSQALPASVEPVLEQVDSRKKVLLKIGIHSDGVPGDDRKSDGRSAPRAQSVNVIESFSHETVSVEAPSRRAGANSQLPAHSPSSSGWYVVSLTRNAVPTSSASEMKGSAAVRPGRGRAGLEGIAGRIRSGVPTFRGGSEEVAPSTRRVTALGTPTRRQITLTPSSYNNTPTTRRPSEREPKGRSRPERTL